VPGTAPALGGRRVMCISLADLSARVALRATTYADNSAAYSLFRAARASRFGSAAVVVARRGKNASARSFSVRRCAISDARSSD
jgi:hypothetical protein